MLAVLAACTLALGPLAMLKLYAVPYWINVMWLDAVTYLHHHGPESDEKVPWYRGQVRRRRTGVLTQHIVAAKSAHEQYYMIFLSNIGLCMMCVTFGGIR